jgi:hypothetical protein
VPGVAVLLSTATDQLGRWDFNVFRDVVLEAALFDPFG